jgi:hypothetical protein
MLLPDAANYQYFQDTSDLRTSFPYTEPDFFMLLGVSYMGAPHDTTLVITNARKASKIVKKNKYVIGSGGI